MASTYMFPENLGNDQQGHFMVIDAYDRKTIFQSNQKLATFAFFVPGGQTNGQSMVWQQGHDYTDVKLARLATSMLGVGGDVVAGAATLMGRPINPQVDVLFRNTNLREFQFTFLLAPQSKKESEILYGAAGGGDKGMLNRLRYYAAPTLGAAQYDSPSEFEIRFFYNKNPGEAAIPNDTIPKIERGVIKRIDIDYTPTGEWSTFHDGSPVSAMLTFTFMETVIIDKKKIDQGF